MLVAVGAGILSQPINPPLGLEFPLLVCPFTAINPFLQLAVLNFPGQRKQPAHGRISRDSTSTTSAGTTLE